MPEPVTVPHSAAGAPASFEQMWGELAVIGRDTQTGGYRRAGWTPAVADCEAWFRDACHARGLRVESDPIGNLLAWWRPDGASGAPIVTGSHLDSVPDGGAFDGPLGVVSALAAVDELRARGAAPVRPIGVRVFVEEEGARFGLPCLGSRLATGAIDPQTALALRDRDGRAAHEVLGDAGVDLDAVGRMRPADHAAAFVELHVEQGRALADMDAPVAVASSIWPHGRWRFDFRGRSDHAGTARMEDRHDPVLTFAMTALAANKQARLAGARATVGRVQVDPGGTNVVAGQVTGWLDARAPDDDALRALVHDVGRLASDRAGRDGTAVEVTQESLSGLVEFDAGLRQRLAARLGNAPVLDTQAGHDAGVLAAAGVPSAMLFVRNPTGISHAPDEHAEMSDCLAGVAALADVLEELACR